MTLHRRIIPSIYPVSRDNPCKPEEAAEAAVEEVAEEGSPQQEAPDSMCGAARFPSRTWVSLCDCWLNMSRALWKRQYRICAAAI